MDFLVVKGFCHYFWIDVDLHLQVFSLDYYHFVQIS